MKSFRFHYSEIIEGPELDPASPPEISVTFDGKVICRTGPIDGYYTISFDSDELGDKFSNRHLKVKPTCDYRVQYPDSLAGGPKRTFVAIMHLDLIEIPDP